MRKCLNPIFAALTLATSLFAEEAARPKLFGREQTQKFPYSMAGQLIFASGRHDFQGSGTTINSRSVLTAAHNLWDARNGWSTNVEFNRARSGRNVGKRVYARRLFVFGNYSGVVRQHGAESARAFAFDLGGLRFSTPPANGGYAGWSGDTSLLTGEAYNIALGYGAEQHDGDDLLFVSPTTAFAKVVGSFMENDTLTFEGGMSGGPVFAEAAPGDLRIAGIIVAGSEDPPSGGIRAISESGSKFIRRYLQY